MRQVFIFATALVVAVGFVATSAQAVDKPCKRKTQAECVLDKVCTWNTTKNKCLQPKK